SAGTGATNNLMRGLRAGGAALAIVGCHADRFTLKKSGADRNYLVPPASDGGFLPALLAVVAKESIDLVLPGNDDDVRAAAAARAAPSRSSGRPRPARGSSTGTRCAASPSTPSRSPSICRGAISPPRPCGATGKWC